MRILLRNGGDYNVPECELEKELACLEKREVVGLEANTAHEFCKLNELARKAKHFIPIVCSRAIRED